MVSGHGGRGVEALAMIVLWEMHGMGRDGAADRGSLGGRGGLGAQVGFAGAGEAPCGRRRKQGLCSDSHGWLN